MKIKYKDYVVVHGYPEQTKYSSNIYNKMPLIGTIFHPDLGWNTTRLYSEIVSPSFKASKGSYNPSPKEICGSIINPFNGFYVLAKKDGVLHVVFKDISC